MYVGKKYTATRTRAFDMEYSCKRCGFTSEATVVGVGVGQGNSAYFTDNEGAAARAESRAEADTTKNAELTLKLCPCPKCGARDSTGFIVESALALVGSAVGIWALGWLIASLKGRSSDSAAFWIFGITGLVAPVLIFYTTIQWKWTTAARRVVFRAVDEKKANDERGGKFKGILLRKETAKPRLRSAAEVRAQQKREKTSGEGGENDE